MFRSLANIVRDVAEVTVRPIVGAVELTTAPLAGVAREANDMQQDLAADMREGFGGSSRDRRR